MNTRVARKVDPSEGVVAEAVSRESPSQQAPMSGSPAESRGELIARAAYLLAERRNFAPGHEIDDWLAAEAQVSASVAEISTRPRRHSPDLDAHATAPDSA
jgi:Protein of unknown function (DUF2934)